MSTTEANNKELARKYPEEAINEGNLDVIDEIFAPDLVWDNNILPEPLQGPDDVKEFVSTIETAFPDIEVTVEDAVAADDKVVLRDQINGTHKGEFMGIGPTGREVDFQGIEIFRFEDGQVVEAQGVGDMMGFMQQLGFFVVPGPRLLPRIVIGAVKSRLFGG